MESYSALGGVNMYPSLLCMVVSSMGMFIFGFGESLAALLWSGRLFALLGSFSMCLHITPLSNTMNYASVFIINNSRMMSQFEMPVTIFIGLGCHIKFSS